MFTKRMRPVVFALLLTAVFALTAFAATTVVVTGDTAAGENQTGWLFNRDISTSTPFEFNTDEASLGSGSLYVLPIGTNPDDKFIAENFINTPIANINSISYDFLIGGGGTASDENEFYMNVYANFGESDDLKYYDCRYDVVPTSGSTTAFATITFNPTQSYPVATSGSSPHTCPAVPADMDNYGAGSNIRMFALNVGDTSANDAGLDGYYDNVVVDLDSGVTIYDLEPDLEGPVITGVTADPVPVGSQATVTATVDDSATGGSDIAGAEYSFDGGTWTAMDAADFFDSPTEDVTASFPAPSEVGVYNVCVRGTDAAGNTGTEDCSMLAVYDPDGGFVTGGGWIDSPAEAMDPMPMFVWDQDFEVDASGWLDSDDAWYGTATRVASGTDGIASSDGGWHAIMEGDANGAPFSRFDGYRDTWPGSWTAEIDVYLDPAWTAGTGFDYTVAATGTDGNHQRDYIFHVTKDTSTATLLVAGSNNTNFAPREDLETINHYEVTTAGWYTLQHVFYDQTGALSVDLNLLDAGGNVLFTETRFNAADTIPAEVGGNRYAWFTFINVTNGVPVDGHELLIPVGVTGKANFGFVSKYKKGADVPTGSAEFVFKAGDLNFHSNVQEWLVVTGSDYARFKGEGTVNGMNAPDGQLYKFMIWAGDGTGSNGEDTFRIKIWWEDGNGENVVYDNGMDQAIGGGNIVVHTKK